MIYLITGTPGTGKTALVVDMMLQNYEGLFKTKTDDGFEIDRPLYFCHIDGLDTKKLKAHELTEEQLQSAPLSELVPTGSVIVVDECDYTYPVRPPSKDVPPYVKTLKELRHEGFTLILMTQHPSMIDKYVRQLVGKHIHLERKQIGTKKYEWFRCEENLNSQSFANATALPYSPPKRAFDYYKSSSKHIKFTKKLHWVFYAIPVIFGLLAYLLIKIGSNFGNVAHNNDVQAASEPVASIEKPFNENIVSASEVRTEQKPIGSEVSDYVPRIQSLPETKPIYDKIRNPINMETVVGCVATKKSCNCYTEQSTKVYVNDELCRHYVENGIFHRYRNMENTQNIISSETKIN